MSAKVRKRRFDEVDFSQWNFDLGEMLQPLLQPMAVHIAEVVWDDLREECFGYIHMEKQGPCLAYNVSDDREMLLMPFTEMFLHRLPGDYSWISGEDNNERADLKAAIASAMIGIRLFNDWCEKLTDDLAMLLEFQKQKFPEDVEATE